LIEGNNKKTGLAGKTKNREKRKIQVGGGAGRKRGGGRGGKGGGGGGGVVAGKGRRWRVRPEGGAPKVRRTEGVSKRKKADAQGMTQMEGIKCKGSYNAGIKHNTAKGDARRQEGRKKKKHSGTRSTLKINRVITGKYSRVKGKTGWGRPRTRGGGKARDE